MFTFFALAGLIGSVCTVLLFFPVVFGLCFLIVLIVRLVDHV